MKEKKGIKEIKTIKEIRTIKAVIFDMDGVIVDTEGIWDWATAKAIAKYGKEYKREITKVMCVGKGFRESCNILINYYGLKVEVDTFINERRALVLDKYRNDVGFVHGFLHFFNSIIAPHYKTCVATASSQMFIDLIDNKLDLFKLFKNKVYSIADVNYVPKPDPAIFLYAADQLSVKPEECVVIEDSPNGIKAAKAAGMKCIALSTTFDAKQLQEADIIVKSYEEIDLTCTKILS